MKNHEIFKTHPNLKEVHMTSDGELFYNNSDAKLHAKTLENKDVELIVNSSLIDVIVDDDDLEDDAPKDDAPKDDTPKDDKPKDDALKEVEEKAALAKAVAEFDPETVKYPEALKLFKALGFEAENEKKDTIYPLLVAEKAKAQEGVNTQE